MVYGGGGVNAKQPFFMLCLYVLNVVWLKSSEMSIKFKMREFLVFRVPAKKNWFLPKGIVNKDSPDRSLSIIQLWLMKHQFQTVLKICNTSITRYLNSTQFPTEREVLFLY